MEWFSTKVRVVCLIEGAGAAHYVDCVHMFQAKDFRRCSDDGACPRAPLAWTLADSLPSPSGH